jgi:hypothetical protein
MFLDGWMGGWMGVKAVLRIAYSNQKLYSELGSQKFLHKKVKK